MRQGLDLEALLYTALIGAHGLGDKAVHVEIPTCDHETLGDRIEDADRLGKALVDATEAHPRENVFAVVLEGVTGDIVEGEDAENIRITGVHFHDGGADHIAGLSLAASTMVRAITQFPPACLPYGDQRVPARGDDQHMALVIPGRLLLLPERRHALGGR